MHHAEIPAAALNPHRPGTPAASRRGELVRAEKPPRRHCAARRRRPGPSSPASLRAHALGPAPCSAHAGCQRPGRRDVDPVSRQPELKHAASSPCPGRAALAGRTPAPGRGAAAAETALEIESALAPFLEQFDYAGLTLCGRNEPVITLHLAAKSAPSAQLLEPILTAAGLAAAPLHYEDPSRHIDKRALIEHDRLVGIALFGETAAADWLRAAMLADQPASPLRRWLFAPVAKAPAGRPTRGRIVCACRDVSADQIKSAISTGATDLAKLQARLPCGTGCGACVPELNRILSGAREAA